MVSRYVDDHLDFRCMMMRKLLPAYTVKSHQTFQNTRSGSSREHIVSLPCHGRSEKDCWYTRSAISMSVKNIHFRKSAQKYISHPKSVINWLCTTGLVLLPLFILLIICTKKTCGQLIDIMYSSCTYYDHFSSKFTLCSSVVLYISV